MMTLERFKSLIEAYGADPARWPEAERSDAVGFVEASADARRILEEAALLDRVIDLASTTPVTPQLQAKIMAAFVEAAAAPARKASGFGGLLPGTPRWVPAAAFVLSLALGLGAGALVPTLAGLDAPVDAALLALGGIDEGAFVEDGS